MNRKKRTANIGLPTLILLFVALAIVSTGGITYAVMKNKQVTARREISQVQERMHSHRVSISLHETDIENVLDFYRLRDRLTEMNSPLVEIPQGVVEVYLDPNQKNQSDQVVAQR